MGFIEAGATDFWVPRGYVHVIAHLRGTGGPGGTFGFFHAQERRDLHDLVESRHHVTLSRDSGNCPVAVTRPARWWP